MAGIGALSAVLAPQLAWAWLALLRVPTQNWAKNPTRAEAKAHNCTQVSPIRTPPTMMKVGPEEHHTMGPRPLMYLQVGG